MTYKFFALASLIISVFNLVYILDRKVIRISKAAVSLGISVFIMTLLEFFKFEVQNIVLFEKIQDCFFLYIPVYVFSFIIDFSMTEKRKRTMILMYTIPTIYLILALTNDFHKMFWIGEVLTGLYGGQKYRPYGHILPWTYFFFSASLIFVAMLILYKSKNIDKKTKIKTTLVFGVGTIGAFISFLSNFNYPMLFFVFTLTIFLTNTTAINFTWRRLALKTKAAAYELSNDGYIVIDKNQRMIDLNKTAAKFLELDQKKAYGRRFDILEELLKKDGQIVDHNNEFFRVDVSSSDGEYKFIILKNMTKEMITEKEKVKTLNLFHALFENIPDGAVILDVNGVIKKCNKQFLDMFGYTREEVLNKDIDNFILPYESETEGKKLRNMVIDQGALRIETIRRRKDGNLIDVRITVTKVETPEGILLYAIYTDITSEKEAINVARSVLQRDPLTGLYTRQYFIRKLASTLEFSSVDDYNAIIAIDIKDFSTVNSIKGHNFGDEILREIANRLRAVLREGDTIARPYADEFWILLEKVGKNYQGAKETASNVTAKIENEIRKSYYIMNEIIDVRISTGIHVFSSVDSVEDVLRKVNLALSRAKSSRDGVVFYNALIDNELQELAAKERALKEALYNGDLKIFLQPICNSYSDVVGAEALLRWLKKDGTIVPPLDFIKVIEENGMIISVGEEVLRQVCEFISESGDSLSFVDINVSPVQLRYPKMAERFIEIIRANEIQPEKIVLEITENILIEMNQTVRENIQRLLDFGCQLCIDDFGTGYSSLSYLTILPLKKIKVDRSFVSKIPDDRYSIKLLEAIFNIARAFNLDAIPEGVEDEKQLQVLSMIGYKYFQGYYFSKPMPIEQFVHILLQKKR
ncbi:EAL domain-containing protein [Fervidobacterium sp.]